jgi:hypothetical protein
MRDAWGKLIGAKLHFWQAQFASVDHADKVFD